MDANFTADLQFNEFHRITEEELNELVRDLDLAKSKGELLGSRLQQWKSSERKYQNLCVSLKARRSSSFI
jgi:hypothetical protein